ATQNEIEVLQRLTAARCSATPSLLAVKIDVQDVSLLNSKGKPRFEEQWGENKQWWMPGGYIVYILMTKLDAEPLDIVVFWDERVFNKQQRDEVRNAFQASYLYADSHPFHSSCSPAGRELKGLGVIHGDARLENLMWNKTDLKW
ncbi:MAG: hypothetical protein L6R36_008872, partial [Xanthoria steineri]